MADRYERWNKWAPRYIADYMHDFGLKDFQAAGLPGNFGGAESGYFNKIQEERPLVPGSAGGLGHAQWTGMKDPPGMEKDGRRIRFMRWLKRKGYSADSYEGNYSYSFRELAGLEPGADYRHVIKMLRNAKDINEAAYIVGKYYEGPKVLNMGPRIKGSQEALALYRANPVGPTVWPTDAHKEPTTMPVPSTPEPGNVVVMPAEPAKVWWKSGVFTGSGTAVVAAGLGAIALYQPGVPLTAQSKEFWTAVVGVGGAAWSVYSRLSSNAQPITATQAGADKVTAERTLATTTAANDAATVAALNTVPVPIAAQPALSMEDIPAEQMSVQKFLHEVLPLVGKVAGVIPQLAAFAKAAEILGDLTKEEQPFFPPRKP